jgi:hypothetical protein
MWWPTPTRRSVAYIRPAIDTLGQILVIVRHSLAEDHDENVDGIAMFHLGNAIAASSAETMETPAPPSRRRRVAQAV